MSHGEIDVPAASLVELIFKIILWFCDREAYVFAHPTVAAIFALLLIGGSASYAADECSAILQQGVFNTYQGLRTRNLKEGFQESFCQNTHATRGSSTSAGLNVTIPVKGVPVGYRGDYGQTRSKIDSQGSCKNTSVSIDDATYEDILLKVVAPEIVAAWSDCHNKAGGFFINGDLNEDVLVLEFRFRPSGAVSQTTLTADPVVYGATCANMVVKKGTVISTGKTYQDCKRHGASAVTVIANSTFDGARFFIPAVVPLPPPPTPPTFPDALVGNYQVRLGPGGGCGGGAPNSFPMRLARVEKVTGGGVQAVNECGNVSAINIVSNAQGFWWNQPVSFNLDEDSVIISETRPNGNSWQKVQR